MSTFYASTSDLYHYGVLGMKWGVRKSAYTSDGRDIKRAKLSKNEKRLQKYDKKKLDSREKDIADHKKDKNDARQMLADANRRSKMSDNALLKDKYGPYTNFSSKANRDKTIKSLRKEIAYDKRFYEGVKRGADSQIKRIRRTPLSEFTLEESSRINSGKYWIRKR